MTSGNEGRPSHWKLYSLIGLMTFLWSVNYIVAKIALREMPSMMLAGVRMTMAGLLILPVYFWEVRKNGSHGWIRKDVPVLLGLGILGVSLNQLFFVIGIGMTSVAHAAVLIGVTPMLVLLLATFSGQEKLRAVRLVGMAMALGGVAVLQLASSKGTGASSRGDFFVLLCSLVFALFTVLGKRVAGKFGAITMNTFAYVGGAVTMLPVTLWYSSQVQLAAISWKAWTGVLFMAAFPSVLCYVIYYYALSHIPASRVSAFSYLQPLLATSMAIFLLAENPTASLMIGGPLVLAGVFVAERT